VSAFNTADLKKLDAGSWFDEAFRGERVPTLTDVLGRYRGQAHFHLELKSSGVDLADFATALERYGWLGASPDYAFSVPGITVTSVDVELWQRSRSLLVNISQHWLRHEISDEIIEETLSRGLQGLAIPPAVADAALVRSARRMGLAVRGFSVRSDEDIEKLFLAGAQGTTTDWPEQAVLVVSRLARSVG
jgi:glycerophosphoryl diester phosphodiesterase